MIKIVKTHNASTRNRSNLDFRFLTNKRPIKNLLKRSTRRHGKNNRGIQTTKHRGGGHKRLHRNLHFQAKNYGKIGRVIHFEYDPNRNANLALIQYTNGDKQYVLQTSPLQTDTFIQTLFGAPINGGNSLPLKNIPLGTEISNIEIHPGKGGQLVRSAGTYATILSKENKYVSVKLPSGEIRNVLNHCWATVGQVGNFESNQILYGKAGRKRWLNKRPKVRGCVMNPVDHPHGGGEGKAPIGKKHPVTPWGKATLGKKTRRHKKYSNPLIIRKRI